MIEPPDPPAIIGRASVIDGDTIEIRGQRIRLWGVDAPEGRQTCTRAGATYRCGQEAANALDALLRHGSAVCRPAGRPDRYGRVVARCTIQVRSPMRSATFRDLGEMMVESGQAVDYPTYSRGAYAFQQASAEAERRGLWAGEFQKPWEWRAR